MKASLPVNLIYRTNCSEYVLNITKIVIAVCVLQFFDAMALSGCSSFGVGHVEEKYLVEQGAQVDVST